MKTKSNVRVQIQSDIEAFMAKGGSIKKITTRSSGLKKSSVKNIDTSALPQSLKVKFNLK